MIMTVKKIIALLCLGFLLALGSIFLIIFSTDPLNSGIIIFVGLYLGLMIAITTKATILGLIFRHQQLDTEPKLNLALKSSIRQGLILATFAVIFLVLLTNNWLAWWKLLILVILAILSEIFLAKI